MPDPKPERICFPFTGDVVGGSHLSVLGLIKALDPSRFQPIVLPQVPDGNIATLFRQSGIATETGPVWTELPYAQRPGPRQAFGALFDLPAQIRFLRQRRVAIVHTNDGRTHATWGLAARLAGAKLLWHHRGDPTALGLRFVAPLLANHVATVSRFSLPSPGLFSAAKRAEVVHSPFDTSIVEDRVAARATLVKELGCHPAAQLICYLGAFVARKRPFLFIDAISELVRLRPGQPVMGLMFGEDYDGVTEQALIAHAEARGIPSSIAFMGFRKRGTFWLAGCDVLMIPAIGEPFGRTLVEAMLVRTPIVATASGGNIEAIQDGELGVLVKADDALALADGCLRLRDDQALQIGFVTRAYDNALTRFGIATHAKQIMAIYGKMLGSPRAPFAARRAAKMSI
jgi:glycosyltransferase involved in cell wall biosynthesis